MDEEKKIEIEIKVTEGGEVKEHKFSIYPPFEGLHDWSEAKELCEKEGGRLPSISELAITHACQELDLIKEGTDTSYWSGSLAGSGLAWRQHFGNGYRSVWPLTYGGCVRCVRS